MVVYGHRVTEIRWKNKGPQREEYCRNNTNFDPKYKKTCPGMREVDPKYGKTCPGIREIEPKCPKIDYDLRYSSFGPIQNDYPAYTRTIRCELKIQDCVLRRFLIKSINSLL